VINVIFFLCLHGICVFAHLNSVIIVQIFVFVKLLVSF